MTALLLLDIGNTRLKWSLARDGIVIAGDAIAHDGDPATAVQAMPQSLTAHTAWMSNVTGEENGSRIAAQLAARYGCTTQLARVRAECAGLRVAYADHTRLGVDRWLAMLALWGEQPRGFVVAGCGTALTFDAVDDHGQHLGGIIAPGLMTAQRAVLGATRFAAAGPELRFDEGLGRDTEACVRQGALHACAGLVERLARRHAAPGARRVLTGGDAATLAPHLEGEWQQRELVVAGLLTLARAGTED